jgi:hypothetical protein
LPLNSENKFAILKKFNYLMKKPILSEKDNIINYFNSNSCIKKNIIIEKQIEIYPIGSIIQVIGKNYYYIDKSNKNKIILHHIQNN